MKFDTEVKKMVDSYGGWMEGDFENRAGGTGRMTKALYPYTQLFSPILINKTKIKNRVVMGPMGNINMCEESGRPNKKMLEYFFARAEGGVGLLTTGLVPISHGIDHSVTEPHNYSYFPRIDGTRTNLVGWRDLAQGCHAFGSKIFIQLTPGLGRVGNPQCLLTKFRFPVSASNNPNFYISEIPSLRLSGRALGKIIKNAGQAAADAKECGLDGVYLHGHEGYLLEQLTNPAFNRRKIGKYADWQRFGLDLVKEIRNRAGTDYPIMYRIDLSLALNETYGEEGMKVRQLKKFKNGRTIQETLDYMKNLVKCGVDIFDIDLGCYDNWWLPHPPGGMPAGCFLGVSKIVKDYFAFNNIISNAGVPVPVVAVGKLGYPDVAEAALRNGDCDMVMLARPLLADAAWCNKAYAGKVEDIRPCIGCQEGCINEFVLGGHPQCAVNPRTGFEDVLPFDAPEAEVKKNIGVIGAGPAGIVFALKAAKRGHNVELFEKTYRIGGSVITGSVPKIKYDFENYLNYLQTKVEKAKAMPNFKLSLNTEVDLNFLKDKKFDALVFAYGGKPISLSVPGSEKIKTIQAADLLLNPKEAENAKRIVIIGGGVVGCETAYWLKYEHKKDVTVVEMLPYFMKGVCTANRGYLIYYMQKAGVKLLNCAKLIGLDSGKAIVEQNISKGVPNPYNTWQPILPENIPNPLAKKIGNETKKLELEADLIVFAVGNKTDDNLYFSAQVANIVPEIYNIGDSSFTGKVLEATRAAERLAVGI